MLAKAREDLAREQEQATTASDDDAHALKVRSISVVSGYRDPHHDLRAWERAFAKHYKKTQSKRDELDDPLGDDAVELLARHLVPIKAVPGFSNHTSGIAVDFETEESGVDFSASSDQRKPWLGTWFHQWLVAHAAEYGFHQLATEEWHWDYRGRPNTDGGSDGEQGEDR